MQKIRLIHTSNGHNKYYEIEPLEHNPTMVRISYGRIGTRGTHIIESKAYGDKKYKEKINKGYIDVSETVTKMSIEDIFADFDLLEKLFNEKAF